MTKLGLTALALLLLTAPTFPASLAWDPPATYTNGTPVPPTEILGYRVFSGPTSTDLSTLEGEVGPTTTQFVLDPSDKGRYLTVTAIGRGGESLKASPILWLSPSLPSNLRILIEITPP